MQKKQINVLLLTTSFPIIQGAKSGIFIWQMIRHLPPHINLTVLTPTASQRDFQMHQQENFHLHCFSYAPRKWQILAHQPGGLPFVLQHNKRLLVLLPFLLGAMFFNCFRLAVKSDLIHANWSVNGVIAGVIGFVLRKPVITTLRGSDIQRAQNNRLDKLLLNICLRLSVRLTTVSHTIEDILTTQYPRQQRKIVTVSNGVNQHFLDVKRSYEDAPPMVFITAGSLTPEKGVHIILQALSLLDARLDVRLNVLGGGGHMDDLQALARELGVHERVSFMGEVPHTDMPSYLQDSHTFILASFNEGRPNVILEAMAAGLPVIASNIPAVKELIADGENGLLFKTGQAGDLAARMVQLIGNIDLQRKIGEAGRQYIFENRLFMSATAEHYQHIYEDLCRVD